METFVARYRPAITAVLSGFDRLVFRGTLLPLVMKRGMHTFLSRAGVRLLDFKKYVSTTSGRIQEASLRAAVEQSRPVRPRKCLHIYGAVEISSACFSTPAASLTPSM